MNNENSLKSFNIKETSTFFTITRLYIITISINKKTIIIIIVQYNYDSPSHVIPSPFRVNPAPQLHKYDPAVLVHTALASQSSWLVAHSFISDRYKSINYHSNTLAGLKDSIIIIITYVPAQLPFTNV